VNDQEKTKQQLIEELADLERLMVEQLARIQLAQADQRQIDNSLPVLVVTAGLDGYYKKVNAAFERILGWSEQDSLSRPFMEFIHPDDRAAAVEAFEHLKSGGTVTTFVDRIVCKDGSHRWINWSVIPLPDRDVVFGIGRDITEKRLDEEERQRLEAKWRSVVENAPAFVALLDDEDKMQFLNRAAPGMNVEDAIGKSTYEFLQPEHVATARESIARVRRTGETAFYECVGAGPNGEMSWYETHVGPVKVDDELVAVSLISNDITERKQAEAAVKQSHDELDLRVKERTATLAATNEQLQHEVEQRRKAEKSLRKSEAKYRTLVEASPYAVVMSDLTGQVLFASRRAAELLGFDNPDDLCARKTREFVIEEEHPQLAENLSNLAEVGVRKGTEYTGVRSDGGRFPVEVSSAVIRDAHGEPKALMAVIRDITERKQVQVALERERQTLIHMLRASDHERQTIAYDMHDGLTQQLAAASMQFQTHEHLKDHAPGKAKTAYDAGVAMVQQAHLEARRLISGVRPPALDESGIAVALAHLVNEKREPKEPEIAYHDDVEFDRLPPILENAIYRIAQEALTNACQHSRSEKARVSLLQEGDLLRLEVQDWGVGFDPESVSVNHFGLEGIKERTRLLGGECSIESEPGKGTCILVMLPILEQE